MSFGDKLRTIRKEKGLTQKELAQKIGARHTSISNWEKEQNLPDGNKILLLIKALDTTPETLLGHFDLNDLTAWEEIKNANGQLTVDQRAALEYGKAVNADIWNKLDSTAITEYQKKQIEIEKTARAMLQNNPQVDVNDYIRQGEEGLMLGLKLGILLSQGNPVDANTLKAIGTDDRVVDFLLKYMELDEEGQEYVRKSLDLSLRKKEGGETEQ